MSRWPSGAVVFAALAVSVATACAQAPTPTPRNPHQVILFRQQNPCPETGKTTGACPGWVVDHIYPLCAGGADDPKNMTWQQAPVSYIKDKLERDFCACLKRH